MAKGVLLLTIIGTLCLMAFSRPLQQKTVYPINGVPDSASYLGGHSGRSLDFYPERKGHGLNSGHAYSYLEHYGLPKKDKPDSKKPVTGLGEAAAAFYFFGRGKGGAFTDVEGKSEQKPNGTRSSSTKASSGAFADTTNSKPLKKSP